MRASVIITALIFSFAAGRVFAQGAAHTPFTGSSLAGIYELQQGTDDCPREITWQQLPKCSGFKLSETGGGQTSDFTHYELFCHINKKSITQIERQQGGEKLRVSYRVTADERMARKLQQIERSFNGAPYNLELQASVILDDETSFMYDRSLGGNGWSCLYKKAAH